MKCAKEIVMVSEQVLNDREKEKIAKAVVAHTEACKNAIKYCETVVGPAFEEKAKKGYPLNVYCRFKAYNDCFGNTHFDIIDVRCYTHTVHHRDGTKSKINKYEDAVVFSNIDKITFIDYLNKYCYSFSIDKDYFLIEPKPSCN